jgi:hypothetical protein
MRNPEVSLTHHSATKGQLLALAAQVPGAWEGLKIAALLLALEGQRPGWIAEVLGLTRMSLNRWIHRVNAHGVQALKPPLRVGRPSRLTPALGRALERDVEKSPRELGLNRVQWDGPTLVTSALRDKLEGSPSTVLDAPVGLWLETGGLQLSPCPCRAGPAVPAGTKWLL